MLAARFASTKLQGLRRLVLSNAIADIKTRYKVTHQYRLELPEDIQAVLKEHEEAGSTSSKEYNEAFSAFSRRQVLTFPALPRSLQRP